MVNIKDLSKRYKVHFIFSTIFLAIGIAFLLFVYKFCRVFHWGNIFAAFLPFLIISFMLYQRNKGGIKDKPSKILLGVLIPIFIISYGINFIVLIFNETLTEIDNPKSYSKILRIYNYKKNNEISHFPSKINKDMKGITFVEHPPFLQGGGIIYLSYIDSSDNIVNLETEFNKKSKYILVKDSEYDKLRDKINIPNKVFETLEAKRSSITLDELKIFIIDSAPYKEKDWNHGTSYGFAINTKTNRVVYWYERW